MSSSVGARREYETTTVVVANRIDVVAAVFLCCRRRGRRGRRRRRRRNANFGRRVTSVELHQPVVSPKPNVVVAASASCGTSVVRTAVV